MIRFGRCQCCEVLKSERDFLRSMLRPKPEPEYNTLPSITLEADALISGAGTDQVVTDPELNTKQAHLDSERAALLSGTYE